MPFVNAEHRLNPDHNVAGDRCFLQYKFMLDKWRASPRWTTADELYAYVLDNNMPELDWQRAKELAWAVFFNLHVMPYELQKRKENGEVE